MLGIIVIFCLSASLVSSKQLNKFDGVNLICKCKKECQSTNIVDNTKSNIKGFSFIKNKILPHYINFKMDNFIYEKGELTDFYTHPFAIEFGINEHDHYVINRRNLFLTIDKFGQSNSNFKQKLFKCTKIFGNPVFFNEFFEIIKKKQKEFNILTDNNKI